MPHNPQCINRELTNPQKKDQKPKWSNKPSTKPRPQTICSKNQSPKSQMQDAYPDLNPKTFLTSIRRQKQRASHAAATKRGQYEVWGPAVGVRSPPESVAHIAHALIREVTAILPWGIPP